MPISHIENADFLAEVRQMNVSMLVVDEARCISEWFRSFRPAYLLLGDIAWHSRSSAPASYKACMVTR
jgi:superfamily II DNA helicase RecQ